MKRSFSFSGPFSLRHAFRHLAHGPTAKFLADSLLWASRTPMGPATIHIAQRGQRIDAEAFGVGADWLLSGLESFLGLDQPAYGLAEFDNLPLLLCDADRRSGGIRLPRTRRIVELLVHIVLEQLVSAPETKRAYANIVFRHSERAPGPAELKLWLPPTPEFLAAFPLHSAIPLGVISAQARTLQRLGQHASLLESCDEKSFEDAYETITQLPGLGPWSAFTALGRGMGDPDAVPVGDYHLKNHVAYNLAGKARGTDEEMLQLLAPYAGRRGVVVHYIQCYGKSAPRRGPRRALRSLP